MENQESSRINRTGISFVVCSIITAWLLDLLSTWIGLRLGLHEANQIFLRFPYLWLFAVLSVVVLIYFFKWAPVWVRKVLLFTIMLGSFSPALLNLYMIIFMVIL